MKLLHYLLVGCGLLPAFARALPPQDATPPSQHTAQFAADAQAAVPEVAYVSALSAYAPAAARTASPDQLWLESNRALAASDGMAGMHGMAHMAAATSHDHGATAGAASAGAGPVSRTATQAATNATPPPATEPAIKPEDKPEDKAKDKMPHPMAMPMGHMHHQGM